MTVHTQSPSLIPGLAIGHAASPAGQTGCTVVVCPAGATGGVAVQGGAPATRETDLLGPEKRVDRVHAILLTGGSAFGLGAADGVMRWLRERGHGWPTPAGPVPIVPAAAIFDPGLGGLVWPDAALGYAACEAAAPDWPTEGPVGAGRGATVGKILGLERSSPGGIGVASMRLVGDVTVGALVVVNALGHVIDPHTGNIVAGARLPDGGFVDTVDLLLHGGAPAVQVPNTTIGVVWTDACLDKAGCRRIAVLAHNGLARTIRPVHTPHDGDTLFTLSVAAPGASPTDLMLIGVAAAEVVAEAVVRAVTYPRS